MRNMRHNCRKQANIQKAEKEVLKERKKKKKPTVVGRILRPHDLKQALPGNTFMIILSYKKYLEIYLRLLIS